MTLRGHERERRLLSALLFVAGFGCAVIASGVESLSQKNELRRAQARRLAECVARPDVADEGPIDGLDGMFGRTLLRVNTDLGPAVVFASRARGGRS